MITLRLALGSILFVALFATGSMAQNNRTFVSGAGSDSNPCSLTSPCRTFGLSDGIDINAGSMDIVILRGLTVNSEGSAGSGIVFNSGAALHVESCVANGFTNGFGIAINNFGISL
jgi:hypothetical protein